MVNTRPNAEAEVYHELKYHSRCKLLEIEPEHVYTIREMAENLDMSPRDLIFICKKFENEGKVKKSKKQSPKFKARKRNVYTVIDRRLLDSNDLIQEMNHLIDGDIERLRKLAKKMRNRPSMKSIKMIPLKLTKGMIRKNKKGLVESRSYQGKIDKIGHRYLEQFCEIVKNLLEYIEALDIATYDDSIKSNDKNEKIIKDIRSKTVKEITGILEYIFKPYSARLQHAVYEDMIMRVPVLFRLTQIQKRSKLRI